MKKFLFISIVLISFNLFAKDIICQSHTYGDDIFEITVNPNKMTATIIGTDRWYRVDFLNETIRNITLKTEGETIIAQGNNLLIEINKNSPKYFGSPALYKTMKLDFDCRENL